MELDWQNLDIDDDLKEYILGILMDTENEDRHEVVVEILNGYFENLNSEEIVSNWITQVDDFKKQEQEQEELTRQTLQQQAKDLEKSVLMNDLEQEDPEQLKPKRDNFLDRKQREALLQQYGYDQLDEVRETADGELEIVYKDQNSTQVDSNRNLLLDKNMNAERVKQKEQMKKERSKLEHQRKVLRDKEQQEKERLKKEKEKQRTQKKEKRRM